ncbi:heavy metal translocating P-type ATPase [Nitrogeniibacter aestuarii]|uniref:heavy metal translocating P-type ATPase n=1 Tax=Nitrogeniibacter aestuarii TaxID=2815343 RepID=UPI001D10BD61|nr:heavy metal translocating P-type ATPase [Nitrogeniibacter aestuarii]
MSESSVSFRPSQAECYHCGLPVPSDARFEVRIGGAPREMCCAGCQAVAQAIVDNGLDDYYRHRDAMPESQKEAIPEALEELGLFDHPDFQKSFVRPVGEHEREAALILEGITCAACVWLNEQHVAALKGVTAISINYATRRARVRWDEREVHLSDILAAVQAIGYRAYPYDEARSEQIAKRERRSALWRLFVAGFGMMQVMMYAIPAYVAGDGDMTADIEQLLRWASFILTLPVVFYSAAPFFQRAWRDVRLKRLGMDVPVALGVGSAFLASCWATFTASGEVYFDSVAMFVFFLLCGRYLEMVARQKAVRGVESLGKVLPVFADKLLADGGEERVPVSTLVVGDRVRVRPGEAIPADGQVLDGESAADEALLTGESRPVSKTPGDLVTGGSVNVSSPLVIEVQQIGDATRLAAIMRLMERASAEKPALVQMADRIAARFIAFLLLVAVTSGIGWYLVDPDRALWVFVSVLVVSCPCALSLATPAALTVSSDAMSKLGVLITRGHAIEALAKVDTFMFDKTGTLTEGRMRLAEVRPVADGSRDTAVKIAAALEAGSEHAIATAILNASPGGASASGVRATTGQGVEGVVDGIRYRIGREGFVADLVGRGVPDVLAQGDARHTTVFLGSEGAWVAAFDCTDMPREDAAQTIRQLEAAGIRTGVLSGDAPDTVTSFAKSLSLDDARGGLTPQQKYEAIALLQAQHRVVAMVGDGVNDAPVLAQAHVSIAMGGGTELARTQADVVLLGGRLQALVDGVMLARRTFRIIRQNLTWAFGYNMVAIPLAVAGWVTPWMAGIGMSASSLMVVLNALRLQRANKGPAR